MPGREGRVIRTQLMVPSTLGSSRQRRLRAGPRVVVVTYRPADLRGECVWLGLDRGHERKSEVRPRVRCGLGRLAVAPRPLRQHPADLLAGPVRLRRRHVCRIAGKHGCRRRSLRGATSVATVDSLALRQLEISGIRRCRPAGLTGSLARVRLAGGEARARGSSSSDGTGGGQRRNRGGAGNSLAARSVTVGAVPRRAGGQLAEALRMVGVQRGEILPRLGVRPFRRATHSGTYTGGSAVALWAAGPADPNVCAQRRWAILADLAWPVGHGAVRSTDPSELGGPAVILRMPAIPWFGPSFGDVREGDLVRGSAPDRQLRLALARPGFSVIPISP